jgi:hypothetical protein
MKLKNEVGLRDDPIAGANGSPPRPVFSRKSWHSNYSTFALLGVTAISFEVRLSYKKMS